MSGDVAPAKDIILKMQIEYYEEMVRVSSLPETVEHGRRRLAETRAELDKWLEEQEPDDPCDSDFMKEISS